MTVTTHIDDARDRVQTEQDRVDDKLTAFDVFEDTVDSIATTTARSTAASGASGGGLRVAMGTQQEPTSNGISRVRDAFAETVRPHSVTDIGDAEPLLETIREELGDDVALALAPTTETRFTPDVKAAVLRQLAQRREEARAMRQALEAEAAALQSARETLQSVIGWIVDTNPTPLSSLGFDALQDRHEMLAAHRECLDRLATERQEFLQRTSNSSSAAGITHDELVRYLYSNFPMQFPVLWTIARLADICQECQQTVRAHLVRRA